MRYTHENLLIRPVNDSSGLIAEVTPETAGWEYISFQVRRLARGAEWSCKTGENELAFVNLSGRYAIRSNKGEWQGVGGRANVFAGAPHVLYLPRGCEFTVTAEDAGEFAVAWTPTNEDHAPFLTCPENVPVSIRGGDNACRQIADLLPPGSPVHRLVLVEVYTPGGNWSSYPPHKHDNHIGNPDGGLVEADLEEVYFFKFDRPEGYAFQWVYTDETSPMQQAGNPVDAVLRPEENCVVLVPEGYHPVASPPGYTTYYLNVLAGSAQSLANQDDPRFTWVKHSYTRSDGRLPLF
jgi:5-deoxy-glucuronate isomerase